MGNLKETKNKSGKLALLGIPHDGNSSFMKGAAAAPPLIREALYSDFSNMWSESGIDLGAEGVFFDAGSLELKNSPGSEDFPTIETAIFRLVKHGMKPISLGGDHAITFPIVKGLERGAGKIDILVFDAHPDLYHEFQDNPFSHACPFARIMETGLVNRLVQVGIRTWNAHQRDQAEKFGVEIIEMRRWRDDITLSFDLPLYISFDLDVLDPGFAPAISHQEPGGLSVRQAIRVIQALSAPEIIGADVVELNPKREHAGMTANVAAKMLKEVAARMLELDAS